MLGIQETFGRIGLRVFVKRLSLGFDQAGVLGFSPPLFCKMNAWTVSWLTRPNSPSIGFHNGQFRWLFRTYGQRIIGTGRSISPFGQLAADILRHPLNALGGHTLTTDLSHYDASSFERPCFGSCHGDTFDKQWRELTAIKSERRSLREKKTADTSGSNRPFPAS
jgi:hypothetical protein